jgi:transcription initiation factor TFIID TATA-box-binding protein
VGLASLCRELELSAVAVGLGLEGTEYDPELFPGIVYRPEPSITTIIFRSGSVVITGSSYLNILEGWQELCDDLEQIGVKTNRK